MKEIGIKVKALTQEALLKVKNLQNAILSMGTKPTKVNVDTAEADQKLKDTQKEADKLKKPVVIPIDINIKKVKAQIAEINEDARRIQDLKYDLTVKEEGLEKAKKTIGDFGKSTEVLQKRTNRAKLEMKSFRKEITVYENKIKKGTGSTKELNESINKSKEGLMRATDAHSRYTKEIKNNNRAVTELKGQNLGSYFKTLSNNLATTIKRIGAFTAAFLLIRGIKGLFSKSIQNSLEFESALAGVNKTLDLTAVELAGIDKELTNLSKTTPLTYVELAKIAEIGGQLGIAKEEVVKFSEVMGMLKTTTNITSEQGILKFAKFNNVLGNTGEEIKKVASTIVDLGNNSATTESQILTFATRIASSGKVAGFTSQEILAIGTAFSSAGIEAESGGTAVQKIMLDMNKAVHEGGKQLDIYAKTSGLTSSEFKNQWEKSSGTSFAKFVTGLKEAGDKAGDILGDLGQDNVRTIRAFLATAQAGQSLEDQIVRANIAYVENIALQEEFDKRASTNASQLQMQSDRWKAIGKAIGDILVPAMIFLQEIALDTIEWLSGTGKVVGIAIASFTGLTVVFGVATIAAGLLSGSLGILRGVLAVISTPIVIFAGGLTLLGGAIYGAYKYIKPFKKGVDILIGVLKGMRDVVIWLGKKLNILDTSLEKAAKETKNLEEEQKKLSDTYRSGAITIEEYNKQSDELKGKIYDLATETEKAKIKQDAFIESLSNFEEQSKDLEIQQEKLNIQYNKGLIGQEEYDKSTNILTKSLEELELAQGKNAIALDIINGKQDDYVTKIKRINNLKLDTQAYDLLIKKLKETQQETLKVIRLDAIALKSNLELAKSQLLSPKDFGGAKLWEQAASNKASGKIFQLSKQIDDLNGKEKEAQKIIDESLKLVIKTAKVKEELTDKEIKGVVKKNDKIKKEEEKAEQDRLKQLEKDEDKRIKILSKYRKKSYHDASETSKETSERIVKVNQQALDDILNDLENFSGDELKEKEDHIKELEKIIKIHSKNVVKLSKIQSKKQIKDWENIKKAIEETQDEIETYEDRLKSLNDISIDTDTEIAEYRLELEKDIAEIRKEGVSNLDTEELEDFIQMKKDLKEAEENSNEEIYKQIKAYNGLSDVAKMLKDDEQEAQDLFEEWGEKYTTREEAIASYDEKLKLSNEELGKLQAIEVEREQLYSLSVKTEGDKNTKVRDLEIKQLDRIISRLRKRNALMGNSAMNNVQETRTFSGITQPAPNNNTTNITVNESDNTKKSIKNVTTGTSLKSRGATPSNNS